MKSGIQNTAPTFFLRWELLCFPFPAGLGGEQGHPSAKMHWCITGEPALVRGKIFRTFRIVPPSPLAVWESSWGLVFSCNPEYKTLLPPFFFGGSFCVSHSLRDCGEEQGRPSVKTRRCITGESALAGRKIFRALQIVPPSPRAVWESSWGLVFSCNPEYKTLLPPFLSPAGAGMKKQRR